MKKSTESAHEGFAFAIFGVFFYVIYAFIPILPIQTISAICLLLAIYYLFASVIFTKKEQHEAIQLQKQTDRFQQHVDDLTKEWRNGQRDDGKGEDEARKDDVDP